MFSWEWLRKGTFMFWRKGCKACGCKFTVIVVHYIGARRVAYPTCSDCVEHEAVV